ncbi:MAG: trypsin-like peptidase domain-containing protein [Ruminococcus sp.]|nr:trypsin-like peptidase domain-containing protein [Ruminococcus sp.]
MMNYENENNVNTSVRFDAEAPFNPYRSVPQQTAPRSTKKRAAAKFAAGIMAMAMVSFGSVAVYRAAEGDKVQTTKIITEYVDRTTGDTLSADAMSFLAGENTSGTAALSTEDIVDKLLPTVVGITSEYKVSRQNYGGFYGFGMSGGNTSSNPSATGTGVIVSEDGYIVTNAHVIYDTEYNYGLAETITVDLNDGSTYDAEVIGYDTDYDLAVLKIKADGLAAAEFGNSDSLRLGESVIAIGNPLGTKLKNSVTTGVVSGKDRQVTISNQSMTLLQTDAAINSGNSGGPLINKYGQVIGINSSKMSSSYSGASIDNIGFAIPSNEVTKVVRDLIDNGYVTGKPQLGISCQDVDAQTAQMYSLPVGVYVTSVNEGSAAAKAGLKSGDIITAIGGTEVTTSAELVSQKNRYSAGDTVEITFTRSGETKTAELTFDEAEEDD